MAEVVSGPLTAVQSGSIGRDELQSDLDELLEQYLNTLDLYEKAQQQLSKSMSSGFMTLAQANFNNTSRMRYGQDYYDERMQASRKVTISGAEERPSCSISTISPLEGKNEDANNCSKESADTISEDLQNLNVKDDRTTEGSETPRTPVTVKEPKETIPKQRDPVRWFGILVPPALRTAQSHFISAIEKPVPHLVTLSKELRSLEIDIGRIRKQMRKSEV